MNTTLSLLLENDTLDAELEAFCSNDPEYRVRQQQFYDLLSEIAQRTSQDLSSDLEKSFNAYLFRTADLYYLYGLGLRQDLLQTIGAGG